MSFRDTISKRKFDGVGSEGCVFDSTAVQAIVSTRTCGLLVSMKGEEGGNGVDWEPEGDPEPTNGRG
jgi:hypothetical protein